jgi:hypothetical protein
LKVQPERIELSGRDGRRQTFTGVLLGSGSSRSEVHSDHLGDYAARGTKCSACRWFEVAIYARIHDRDTGLYPTVKDYVVHTVGGSVVPREKRFSRIQTTTSPYDVIELVTVRPVDREPFIASQSARALAQAADVDDGIRDAYINRAVV